MFYRCFKSVFGKIGRLALEEVLHLIKSKCMPVLLYAVEACPVTSTMTTMTTTTTYTGRFTGISFHKNFNENFQNKIQRNCY